MSRQTDIDRAVESLTGYAHSGGYDFNSEYGKTPAKIQNEVDLDEPVVEGPYGGYQHTAAYGTALKPPASTHSAHGAGYGQGSAYDNFEGSFGKTKPGYSLNESTETDYGTQHTPSSQAFHGSTGHDYSTNTAYGAQQKPSSQATYGSSQPSSAAYDYPTESGYGTNYKPSSGDYDSVGQSQPGWKPAHYAGESEEGQYTLGHGGKPAFSKYGEKPNYVDNVYNDYPGSGYSRKPDQWEGEPEVGIPGRKPAYGGNYDENADYPSSGNPGRKPAYGGKYEENVSSEYYPGSGIPGRKPAYGGSYEESEFTDYPGSVNPGRRPAYGGSYEEDVSTEYPGSGYLRNPAQWVGEPEVGNPGRKPAYGGNADWEPQPLKQGGHGRHGDPEDNEFSKPVHYEQGGSHKAGHTTHSQRYGEDEYSGKKPQYGEDEYAGRKPQYGEDEYPGKKLQYGEDEYSGRKPQYGEDEYLGRKAQYGEDEYSRRKPQLGEDEYSGRKPQFGEDEYSGRTPQYGEDEYSGRKPQYGEDEYLGRKQQHGHESYNGPKKPSHGHVGRNEDDFLASKTSGLSLGTGRYPEGHEHYGIDRGDSDDSCDSDQEKRFQKKQGKKKHGHQ